jgi:hypothetical protein
VRPSTFVGARDQVTDATLIGPFDGQVVDAATSEPIADAIVVGVWAYDRGDGFIGPPFHVVVYKRGFLGYRSDALYEGGARADFTVRHNRVELRKWRETDSHAEHLLFLASPRPLRKGTTWEQDLANVDLFRKLGGAGDIVAEQAPVQRTAEWLDASALLSPDEVRLRTGYPDNFQIGDITDLERKSFYHGVHFQAVGREETWDIAYRVWKVPPGGLDPVIATIQETMGQVQSTGEITPETWTLATAEVQAVAFVDRDAQVGVMLSCGSQQCNDIDTAIILAKTIYRNLDRLRTIPAPASAPAKPGEPLAPRTSTPAEPGSTRPATPPATTTPPATSPAATPTQKSPAEQTTPPAGTPATPPAKRGRP